LEPIRGIEPLFPRS